MTKLIYGIRDGKTLHISDVEQGLKCDCFCPSCKTRLVAKKGDINDHHFAHESQECNIDVAQETALHIMAKEILSESKTILLPKVIIEDKFAFFSKEEFKKIYKYQKDLYHYKIEKYDKSVRKIDNVLVEKFLGDIKPDIVLEIEGKRLIVEIAVTNFTKNKKKNKIFEMNIPAIEIDLSSYKDKIDNINKDKLKEIINGEKHKSWIYYSNYHKDIEEIKYKNNNILKNIKKMFYYQKNNFSNDYLEFYKENLRNNTGFYNFWNNGYISKYIIKPWFIDFAIDGEILFSCDRRIWQLMVLNKLYFNKRGLSSSEIIKYIKNIDSIVALDFDHKLFENDGLSNKYKTVDIRDYYMKDRKRGVDDVVLDYYKFLQKENIIDKKGKWIYS